MTTKNFHFELHEGVDLNWPLTITKSGSAVDLAGCALLYECDAITPAISKTIGDGITVVDEENGQITINFAAEELPSGQGGKSYRHELRITDSLGQDAILFTGNLILRVSITIT